MGGWPLGAFLGKGKAGKDMDVLMDMTDAEIQVGVFMLTNSPFQRCIADE